MTIIDYFDRTAIINLPERADRRAETREEFKRAGWQIETKKADFFTAIRPEIAAGFPSSGVKGCFLSHMNVIKKAKHDNLANILIMEDDITFISGINSFATEALQVLDHVNWDFIYLGHEHRSDSVPSEILQIITEPLTLKHFYAVNGHIFDRFLKFLEQLLERPPGHPDGGPMYYDGALSTFRMQNRDINTFVVIPSLGYQRSSRSNLHPTFLLDQLPFLNPLTTGLRKLKNSIKRSTR
jgi:hypothetical protein